jgi:hypothetical protein
MLGSVEKTDIGGVWLNLLVARLEEQIPILEKNIVY